MKATAQQKQTDCPQYARLMAKATELRKKQDYKAALYKYNAAQAHCPANKASVQQAIEELLTEIELVKNDAVKAKDQAEKAQAQAKKALKQAEAAQAQIVRQLVEDVKVEIDNQEYEWCIATLKNAMSLGQEKEQVANAMLDIAFIFAHNDTLRPRSQRLLDSVKQFYPNVVQTLVRTGRNNDVWTSVHTTEKYYGKFVSIEGGTFTMGSPTDRVVSGKDSLATGSDEKPAHEVQVSSFMMATTEVTFAQYSLYASAVKIKLPATIDGNYNGKNPVHSVSWFDACRYANWLSEQEGRKLAYRFYLGSDNLYTQPLKPQDSLYIFNSYEGEYHQVIRDSTANGYRLPTEAEWEYAAKEGKHRSDFTFSGSNDLNEVGWYSGNVKKGQTQLVATKKPNRLGLYDMSGNVWEWCEDWYGNYSADSQNNPKGVAKGYRRVVRGGGWYRNPGNCRAAGRIDANPGVWDFDIGFRLYRTR
jgi:formylglycine-generating enzyme required for sulfatase activity